MLSDEERMAIDYLQLCYDLSTITNESLSKLGIVLNLIEKKQKEIEELNWKIQEQRDLLKYKSDKIEKQSKEIEELKEKNRQSKMRIVQLENEITARIEDVNKYFTPNDKIKAKIEEVKDEIYDAKIVLQSLLEKE